MVLTTNITYLKSGCILMMVSQLSPDNLAAASSVTILLPSDSIISPDSTRVFRMLWRRVEV